MTAGEAFEKALINWRNNKGVGTALIPSLLNDKVMVLGVLQRMYSKADKPKVLIVVNNFDDRISLIEFLTNQPNDDENNAEFKQLIRDNYIKIYTDEFVEDIKFKCLPCLIIVYRPDYIYNVVYDYLVKCKFKLVVLNKLINDNVNRVKLYNVAPLLDDFKQNEVEEIRLSTPVEEIQKGITIPCDSEDKKLLDYYNEYVSASVAIFGSFDIMKKAYSGDPTLNISANQICYQIALENGWNEHLDKNVSINVEIDKLYNPMSLKERAIQTYEVVRNRSKFLCNYEGKLPEILKIVRDNPDKKILIISKFGEFASKITEYINNHSERDICANYHDKVDNIPAIDLSGKPIYYKSGSRKGERKVMGAAAQQTLNEKLFNCNIINVLSTTNSPNKSLSITVDIVIITSPLCESIKSYMYRLDKLFFNNLRLDLFTLYIKGTSEEKALQRKEITSTHNVKCADDDETFSDFIVVD